MNIRTVMTFNNEIICVDKSGIENKFHYNLEDPDGYGSKQEWTFRIIPVGIEVDDYFEFTITRTTDNQGKVTQMNNHGMSEYVAKGIPEKMIEESSKVLQLEIVSSTNIESAKFFDTEWRTPQATKVWERLVRLNKAEYNSQVDIYKYTG